MIPTNNRRSLSAPIAIVLVIGSTMALLAGHRFTVAASPVGGTTYIVSSPADSGEASCTPATSESPTSGADCQLRTAMADAIEASQPVTITFALPDAGDTVTLNPVDNDSAMDVDANENVTIDGGATAGSTIINAGSDATNTYSLFRINSGGTFSLKDAEVEDFVATAGQGYPKAAVVQLGANEDTAPQATLSNDIFTNNTVTTDGFSEAPVVNDYQGTVNISTSTFSDNSANNGSGGAIYNNDGTVNVSQDLFKGNSAGDGGAIFNGFTLNVSQSLFTGNMGSGGAIMQNYGPDAGESGPTSLITNSTFALNSAPGYGAGAIDDVAADTGIDAMTLVNDTIADNTTSTDADDQVESLSTTDLTATNTLFQSVGSATPNCSEGGIASGGNNFDSDGSCAFGSSDGNLSPVGPSFAPLNADLQSTLADNGGPTDTLALLAGSPALQTGNATACAAASGADGVDQRGVTRPQGTSCDIGAFEDDLPSSVDVTVDTTDSTITVTVTVVASSSDAGTPEGSVTLSDPGSAVLNGSGSATFTIGPLSSGSYTLSSSFTPSNGFLPQSGSTSLNVAAAPVTTTPPVPDTGAIEGQGTMTLSGAGMILMGIFLLCICHRLRRYSISR